MLKLRKQLKKNGYIHEGMKKLLKSLEHNAGQCICRNTNYSFFKDISLCGPRIIDKPGIKEGKKLCEFLFHMNMQ